MSASCGQNLLDRSASSELRHTRTPNVTDSRQIGSPPSRVAPRCTLPHLRLAPLAAALALGLAASPAGGQGEPPCSPGRRSAARVRERRLPGPRGRAAVRHARGDDRRRLPVRRADGDRHGLQRRPRAHARSRTTSPRTRSRPSTVTCRRSRCAGARPGSYPATVTWTQYDAAADRTCSGSASTTFSLAAPAPPHLTKPRATPRPRRREPRAAQVPRGRRRAPARRPLPRGREAALPRSRRARAHVHRPAARQPVRPRGRRSTARSASAG